MRARTTLFTRSRRRFNARGLSFHQSGQRNRDVRTGGGAATSRRTGRPPRGGRHNGDGRRRVVVPSLGIGRGSPRTDARPGRRHAVKLPENTWRRLPRGERSNASGRPRGRQRPTSEPTTDPHSPPPQPPTTLFPPPSPSNGVPYPSSAPPASPKPPTPSPSASPRAAPPPASPSIGRTGATPSPPGRSRNSPCA